MGTDSDSNFGNSKLGSNIELKVVFMYNLINKIKKFD